MTGKLSLNREEAVKLLQKYDQKDSDWNHYFETEAIMRKLAEKFGEDIEYWGMIGLLHDVDWALTRENWSEHCVRAAEILKEQGFDAEFIQIVQSHGYGVPEIPAFFDKKRSLRIEHALVAAETVTGLIYAYALMRAKKISDMEISGLRKKFKDKSFAVNCKRELIMEIEKTGISLDEFFQLAIDAMKGIKNTIGLI
jgi:putative nucleotidyltransferase with HDIG domain